MTRSGMILAITLTSGSARTDETHNANVHVLGDSDLKITLESDGTNGWPKAGGVGLT